MLKFIAIAISISVHVFAQMAVDLHSDSIESNRYDNQHISVTTSFKRSTQSMYSIGLKYEKPFDILDANGHLITSINYGESNGTEYLNDARYHLKIISKKPQFNVTPEAFLNYETNKFSLTKQQYLAGIGIRYSIGEIISGTALINEWYRESIHYLNAWRLSQFVKFKFKFNPSNAFNSSLHIQPNVVNFNDVRIALENKFISQITKTISYQSTLTTKFFSKSQTFNNVELFFDSGLQFKL